MGKTHTVSRVAQELPALPEKLGVRYRHIADWPGYAVGDDGSVLSCKVPKKSVRLYEDCWRELALSRNKRGYLGVTLKARPRKASRSLVHQLVADAFLGPCPDGLEVLHEDGNASNCRASNLRYGTHQENMHDAIRHGTFYFTGTGERHPQAKLTEVDVIEIRRLSALGMKRTEVAALYNVRPENISHIALGRTWTHLSTDCAEVKLAEATPPDTDDADADADEDGDEE